MPLTYSDIQQIRKIFSEEFDARFNLLPNKDEFFTWMDKIYGELQTIRQEHAALQIQVRRNTERLNSN